MKKTILATSLALLLATAPAMAQTMGGGQMMGGQGGQTPQQMMGQQQMQQTAPTGGQYYNQYMNPGMMGGYGYGMNPQMMGNSGYGMGPGMMGGYGYGMGPQMMGNHGYGMGPNMMGYYSPEQYEKQFKEHQEFLNETKELRKKMHTLKFDFAEAQRNPATTREDLEKMNQEMESIWKQIYEKRIPAAK
jgi:hypothetical protein